MISSRKRIIVLTVAVIGIVVADGGNRARLDDNLPQKIGPQPDGTTLVPTNQLLSPAGFQVFFPGRPTDLVLSPDGTLLAVKNIGDIVLIRMQDRAVLQTLSVEKGGQGFHGILFSADGKRIYTTDSEGQIHVSILDPKNVMQWGESIFLPGPVATPSGTPGLSPTQPAKNPSSPGGMVLDEANQKLWVTLSRNNSLGCVDLVSGKVISQIPVGMAPYTVVIGPARKAYVSNWAGRKPGPEEPTAMSSGTPVLINAENGVAASGTVSVIDLDKGTEVRQIDVGLHPSGMVLNAERSRLFVANANSDTVSVIDTESDQVAETISVVPGSRPFGSSPNALTLSSDAGTLYVANGTDNAICVVSLGSRAGRKGDGPAESRVVGFIPTGWYPGAVLLDEKRGLLMIANTKGIGSRNQRSDRKGYNSHEHSGSLSFVRIPSGESLSKYTQQVHSNNRLSFILSTLPQGKSGDKPVPVPDRPGRPSVFKHVLYIIKENRTYDQLFGDLSQGDGDPALVQFGRETSPNHHALAEQFVLLDNFYCSGVLSADGHQWATEAFATDYLEKSFGGFNRSYPYDGTDPMAYAASGFIWDKVLKRGLSFRDYGEFVQGRITPRSTWMEVWKDFNEGTGKIRIRAETQVATLRPYLCPTFIGFPSTVPDAYRAQEFIKELKEYESGGNLPSFMIMLLPNDHTSGTRPNVPTPRAMVADNDLALGKIVEAVSKSRFWPETVIFVTEDDPQAGLDHVDSHRTVGLVISPYTPRGAVVHTNYNQTGMVRTMELILGLTHMNQFDRGADAMTDCFQDSADLRPYIALRNNIPLDEMNPPLRALDGKARYWAQKSLELDLDDVDRADEDTLNRILWHSVKGYDTPYPSLRR